MQHQTKPATTIRQQSYALLLCFISMFHTTACFAARIPDGVYVCFSDSVGWQGAGGTVRFIPSQRNGQIKISGMQYQVYEKIGRFQLSSDGRINWQGGYYSQTTSARYGLSEQGVPAIYLWWPDVKTGLRCLRE